MKNTQISNSQWAETKQKAANMEILRKEVNLREYFSKIKDGKFRKKEQYLYPIDKNFNKNKLKIMENIIREKFKIPFLRNLLLKTEDLELVELNNWNDIFWGVCNGQGQNWLGKILMLVRSELNKPI